MESAAYKAAEAAYKLAEADVNKLRNNKDAYDYARDSTLLFFCRYFYWSQYVVESGLLVGLDNATELYSLIDVINFQVTGQTPFQGARHASASTRTMHVRSAHACRLCGLAASSIRVHVYMWACAGCSQEALGVLPLTPRYMIAILTSSSLKLVSYKCTDAICSCSCSLHAHASSGDACLAACVFARLPDVNVGGTTSSMVCPNGSC